jgi:hypothetical protein
MYACKAERGSQEPLRADYSSFLPGSIRSRLWYDATADYCMERRRRPRGGLLTRASATTNSSPGSSFSVPMNNFALRPPSSEQFSEQVIEAVVQRANFGEEASRYFFQAPPRAPRPQQPLPPNQWGEAGSWERPAKQDATIARHSTVLAERDRTKKERQQELRRNRQKRYRKKWHSYTLGLEEETQRLKSEVGLLEKRCRAMSAAVPTGASVWGVAADYFRHFRHGVQATSTLSEVATAANPCAQQDFLQSVMAPVEECKAGHGVEAVMTSWRCCTLWFGYMETELQKLQRGPRDSLVAVMTTSFTITERTLRNAFPHLSRSDKSCTGEENSLTKKLLGQRIIMQGSTHFEWDDAYGRVTSLRSQSDLLTPLLQLLGNLEDVSKVFEKAAISPDFQCRSTLW